MQKNLSKVLSCLLAIVMVLSMIPVIASATGAQQVYDGGAFTAGTDLTVSVSNDQPVTKMSFDYKLTTEGYFNIALLPDWSSYFGYFEFNANGAAGNYAGITTEKLSGGTIRVRVNMAELTKVAGTPSKVLTMLYIRGGYSNANGSISNIRLSHEAQEVLRGELVDTSAGKTIALGNTNALNTISFEYKMVDGTKFNMALCPNWSAYFGYFAFGAEGARDKYAGVTTEVLADGYIRVTFDLSALTAMSGTPSKVIDFLYIRGDDWSDAHCYIDNITFA